jgi:hypothetical protein
MPLFLRRKFVSAFLSPQPLTWQLFKLISFSDQVQCHRPEPFRQVRIVTIVCQTVTHARLPPQTSFENHVDLPMAYRELARPEIAWRLV